MKAFKVNTISYLLCFLLLSIITSTAGAVNRLKIGSGSIVFTDTLGNKDKPITVWYYKPEKSNPNYPVVFVMHGVKRNGKEYRDSWVEHAEKEKFLLLVPEFSEKYYPGSRQYNLGNMFSPSGKSLSKSKWTYIAIERIFDHARNIDGLKAEKYSIYGHSAGAQFVHRMVLFVPNARINTAISANSGWYTMPTGRFEFPYGLKKSHIPLKQLRNAFGKNLIVLLGDKDTDQNHKHLRKTKEAMAQGKHRFERGKNFFRCAKRETARLNTPLNWKLQTVAGIGHSNSGMAKAAAKLLINTASQTYDFAENPSLNSSSDSNGDTSKSKPHIAYTEKLNTPDLMQTDPDGHLPNGGKDYCAPVSVSNSFMWLAENGFDNLAPKLKDRKKAQIELARTLGTKEYMNSADDGTGMFGLFRGVSKYIKDKGYEHRYFKYQGWRNHPRELSFNVDIPQLNWLKKGLRGDSAVWLNVGWYKYNPKTKDYLRISGHWVTLVGYGVDSHGKENSNILIMHDPASRAGKDFSNEYVQVKLIKTGRLTGEKKGLPRSAKGYYKLRGGMHIKKTADFAILDGAIVLKMKNR